MENIASLTAPIPMRADRPDEAELVARFRAGDTAAFDQIVATSEARIMHMVSHLLGGPDEVEDVVQDVFLAALQNRKRFRGHCKLSTWLTTIALNKCRSHRRRRRLRLHGLFRLAQTMETPRHEDPHCQFDEIQHQAHRAVHRLSAKYREPIVLRYFQEMSMSQISAVLGISVGAVEVRLSRARRKLKDMLSTSE